MNEPAETPPDKPTLIMIHGLVGSLNYFSPETRLTKVAAWTCDLLGYGTLQSVGRERLTLKSQVELVTRCVAATGSDQEVWLLGHSMGGAIAMLAADRRPDRIKGVVNVEGNFTLKDAFWSQKITAMQPDEWAGEYRAMQDDVSGWLKCCGVEPNTQRLEWATHLLNNQPATTVYAMARALLAETQVPDYLEAVRRVLAYPVPVHLVAGEKSASAWGVPDFVRAAARSYVEPPDVGHLMMLEQPDEFCRIIDSTVGGST